jgi:hypothetical protein
MRLPAKYLCNRFMVYGRPSSRFLRAVGPCPTLYAPDNCNTFDMQLRCADTDCALQSGFVAARCS